MRPPAALLLSAALALAASLPLAHAAYPKRADIERHGWRCIAGHGWWHYAYGWHPRFERCWLNRKR